MFRLDPYDPITVHAEPGLAQTADAATATAPISVLVADDHPLYRQGIIRALEADGGSSSSATPATALQRCG